jgi:hypothetical protein
MIQVFEERGELHVDGAITASLHARLLAFAERDPRRAAHVAGRWFGDVAIDGRAGDGWANYTLGWALLRWERVGPARGRIAARTIPSPRTVMWRWQAAAGMACWSRGSLRARAWTCKMPGRS